MIAESTTEDEYETNFQQLKQSAEWRDDANLQAWIERKWIPERSVSAAQHTAFLVRLA